MKPISDRTWQGRQSWNREIIEQIGDKRVRLTVHVDAYEFQSWARAEVWDGVKWQEAHSIAGERLASRINHTARTCPPTTFEADMKELRTVVRNLLC